MEMDTVNCHLTGSEPSREILENMAGWEGGGEWGEREELGECGSGPGTVSDAA